ncbi:ATP-binding protein [Peptococcaceae bacterium]|nr:ATP-binding protein [Peptococcaceae bacterium]
MRIIEYRKGPFIDREREEQYLLNRFSENRPENILFLYGPKSSGKTTLLEYIAEEKLDKNKFYLNYVNFRRYLISNYSSFLNIYFYPVREENKSRLAKMIDKFKIAVGSLKGEVRIPAQGVDFAISYDIYQAMEQKDIDPFAVMIEVLKNIGKKRVPILILDEVQELEDIYINGDRQKKYLLTEFFKFLVSLTKETHMAHVVVSTSSSIFIDYIYNHSNLAKTNEFYLIDHFDYETTKKWLEKEKFTAEEIDLIWEYLGGCPYDISVLLLNRKMPDFELKSYLEREANIIAGKIGMTIAKELETEEEQDCFINLLNDILKDGYVVKKNRDKLQERVLEKGLEKDILFVRPESRKIIFNSQIMKKGAEIYISACSKSP